MELSRSNGFSLGLLSPRFWLDIHREMLAESWKCGEGTGRSCGVRDKDLGTLGE